MPVLVHLADEREAASIKRNGIKVGKYRPGIFCMPVLPNFYISHQWLRELKRGGARTFVGVYFKFDSKSFVYAGNYNKEHRHIPLGEAIKEIMSINDPLGYEILIDRKILGKEIDKIRTLPQNLGWRYFPGSHSKKPECACPVCITRGSIKSRKLRDKIEPPEKKQAYPEILAKLKVAEREDEICDLLYVIRSSRRRADPKELAFLIDLHSDEINQTLALALSAYRHKNTKALLFQLMDSRHDDTREFAASSLLDLYGNNIEKELLFRNDEAINNAIGDGKSN